MQFGIIQKITILFFLSFFRAPNMWWARQTFVIFSALCECVCIRIRINAWYLYVLCFLFRIHSIYLKRLALGLVYGFSKNSAKTGNNRQRHTSHMLHIHLQTLYKIDTLPFATKSACEMQLNKMRTQWKTSILL